MTSRDELRRTGAAMREKLGFPPNRDEVDIAPGLHRLAEEMVWGSIWARPGLSARGKGRRSASEALAKRTPG